ncbi:MAG: mercury(II) reductase, partial [bacterium]
MRIFNRKSKERSAEQNNKSNTIELQVSGMTCDSCATHVSAALQKVEGVLGANVPSWKDGKAFVDVDGDYDESQILEAVVDAGYGAKIVKDQAPKPTSPRPDVNRSVDYDLVVIGTGGGGMAAAIRAAENGHKVAIVEKGTIGGTCVNIGCVPSKTLIRAAEAYHNAGHHSFAGVNTSADGIDWPKLIGQKEELVSDLRQKKYVEVLESYGDRISLIKGHGKLNKNGEVVLDGDQVIRTESIVIAAGARPKHLPLEGIDQVEVLDSTSLMAIKQQPRSLLVIGGRAIALELGQAFARFGTKVTMLQRSGRLLPEHEPEIGETLANYFGEEGIQVYTGATPKAIREEDGEKIITAEVEGETREFRAEHVLMATGRDPNSRGMGLEEAGVTVDEKGFIIVDEYLQTSNPKIYAVGDVTTLPNFVYVAAAAGGLAATNALNGNSKKLDLSVLPDVVFTDPQIATVGLTESQAIEKGFDVKTSTLPLEHVPRALAARDTKGFIKLIADNHSDRLLGA